MDKKKTPAEKKAITKWRAARYKAVMRGLPIPPKPDAPGSN